MVPRSGEYTYRQGWMRGIVGEERRGKETDGCPLTSPLTLPPYCLSLKRVVAGVSFVDQVASACSSSHFSIS
jgi:hypothetical protein